MKASELRIGNWIQSRGLTREFHAWQVTSEDIPLIEDNAYMEDQYRGIPLTEEWLNKFGFWRREGSNVWQNATGNYRYCVHQTGMLHAFDVRSSDNGSYFINTPKYVHQLQNLYFALTGEELTVQP